MKTSLLSANLKNRAKTMMEGKYYVTIMALIFFHMITLLLTNFSSSLSLQISATLQRLLGLSETGIWLVILSYFVVFLFTALCNVLRIGVCLFFLNIACENYYSSFDLFHGFFENFGKSYGLSFLLTLLSTLALAPLDALIYLFRQPGGIRVDVLTFLIALQLTLLVFYIPISLALSQSYYIMLDYPDLKLTDILRQSAKLMQGRKLQLFYIQISFLPLFLLTVPTFGLGSLWLTPYKNMTYTLFYLDSMKEER